MKTVELVDFRVNLTQHLATAVNGEPVTVTRYGKPEAYLVGVDHKPVISISRFQEIDRAEMAPDLYDGLDCDQVKPQWLADCEKGGTEEVGDDGILKVDCRLYPAGTVVRIEVPLCPDCDQPAGEGEDAGSDCLCGFSWKLWVEDRYQ